MLSEQSNLLVSRILNLSTFDSLGSNSPQDLYNLPCNISFLSMQSITFTFLIFLKSKKLESALGQDSQFKNYMFPDLSSSK